jgi:HD superfamily phosphohydrolase
MKKGASSEKDNRHAKIINDPVHGFIEVPRGILLSLIDTPAFQRLRRIKQLGLSSLVYPGAIHSRFNHALGAMHLMRQALDVLRRKEVAVSDEEYEATLIAILLHDIGHGPFSHALESTIIPGLHHETMSLALMHYLDEQFNGRLSLAIRIFEDKYERKFFHQMVSSQLDLDRMDYLIRDSFFSGVAEGVVGIDRIIKTLDVIEDRLVVESKAIYSVEKFIVSRRLMYWQVYLHKAAMAAENMLVNLLRRARQLTERGEDIYLDQNLGYFFHTPVSGEHINREVIERFIQLDDDDVQFHIKKWQYSPDKVLSDLSDGLLRRKLLKLRFQQEPVEPDVIAAELTNFCTRTGYSPEEAAFFVFSGKVSNLAYIQKSEIPITVLFKNGETMDLAAASDLQNIETLSAPVTRYYMCYPEK